MKLYSVYYLRPYHFFLSPFIFGVCLCEFGFEGLCFPVLFVFVQNVHKVSNVTGSQTKGFDFGQLRIRGHVGNAFPEFWKGAVDALSPAPLLSVCRGFTFHWSGSHSYGAGPRYSSVVRVIEPGGSRRVFGAVGGCHAIVWRRHLRMADKPPMKIRGFFMTATGSSCGSEGIAVMMHHRVVGKPSN